jgi:hypothetical protein
MIEDSETNKQGEEQSESTYWKKLWIAVFIVYGATALMTFYFFYKYFVLTLIGELIFGIGLLIAYFFRIKRSRRLNEIVYIALGTLSFGSGLCFLYLLLGISKYLISLGSWYIYLNLVNFGVLLIIGGFLGYSLGKKRNYRLPYSIS